MYILVTNDDGVQAPGLLALKQALSSLVEVQVIAPDRNWSAAGHTKTMDRPLRIRATKLQDGSPAFACDGAPSDCVAVALLGYLPEKPALIVTGINPTSNVGADLTYSGTVTAAMEGALANVPAIAMSLDVGEGAEEYAVAADFARRLAEKVLSDGLLPETLLNVNVPNLPADQIRGVRITKSGKRIYRDELVERVDPRGHKYYWIGGTRPIGETEREGTDIWALAQHYISITPIHMDMTSHAMVEQLEDWASALEEKRY